MTLNDRAALCSQLMRREGPGPMHNGRFFPYRCPAGKLTIAYGRNIEDVGLSTDEAHYLLENDIDVCIRDLSRFTWFADLDAVRQRALVDLRFNLGMAGLIGFNHAMAAMAAGNYAEAADRFQDSKWYREVGVRGPEVVWMVRTGTEPA